MRLDPNNKKELLDRLFNRRRGGKRTSLANVEALCQLFKCSLSIPAIIVTGTNGKGSVSFYLHHILSHAGIKVGLFTSPHLINYHERFVINGEFIPDDDLLSMVYQALSWCEQRKIGATFFEISTAIALKYFEKNKAEIIILEVGVGGVLDATTIVNPICSIVTSVGLDHMDSLGGTLEEIAIKKAGVIKKGGAAFIGKMAPSLAGIFKETCYKLKAEFYPSLEKIEDFISSANPKAPSYQKQMWSLACKVASYVLKKSQYTSYKMDLLLLKKIPIWPGRFQQLKFDETELFIDVAHNPAAIKKLLADLKSLNYQPIILLGCALDKDFSSMIEEIKSTKAEFLFFKFKFPRSWQQADVPALYQSKPFFESWQKAYSYALKIKKSDEIILLTGSCYGVGEVLTDVNFSFADPHCTHKLQFDRMVYLYKQMEPQ